MDDYLFGRFAVDQGTIRIHPGNSANWFDDGAKAIAESSPTIQSTMDSVSKQCSSC
jgi:hypothetical protein